MDENKLEKLKEIGYQIQECCGTCARAKIERGQLFGTCNKHKYQHLKHNKALRQLSINRYGYCLDYVIDSKFKYGIHAYNEFLKTE